MGHERSVRTEELLLALVDPPDVGCSSPALYWKYLALSCVLWKLKLQWWQLLRLYLLIQGLGRKRESTYKTHNQCFSGTDLLGRCIRQNLVSFQKLPIKHSPNFHINFSYLRAHNASLERGKILTKSPGFILFSSSVINKCKLKYLMCVIPLLPPTHRTFKRCLIHKSFASESSDHIW